MMRSGTKRGRGQPGIVAAIAALLLCVGLLPAAPTAAAGPPAPALRILAPVENAVLRPGDAYIVGAYSGQGAALVKVSLDGKLAKLVTATGGGFWCRLALGPGRHALRVASGGNEAAVSVAVDPAGDYRFHPRLEECDGCHAGRGVAFKTVAPLPALCGKCHKPRDSKKFVHGPVAAGGCAACHGPHGGRGRGLQRTALACFACHQPFPDASRVHDPLKRGDCVSCHSPHSADDRALLTLPGNAICTSCHREFHAFHRAAVKEGSMTRVPESFPKDKGTLACAGCHAPHQSNEKFLLKVNAERLCKTCHG